MNKETKKALQKCIDKYEGYVKIAEDNLNEISKEFEFFDYGIHSCALCSMFYNPRDTDVVICKECPVFDSTKQTGCKNTPYEVIETIISEDSYLISPKLITLFHREVDFLKSLMPKDKD
jgi:hypothetical protein